MPLSDIPTPEELEQLPLRQGKGYVIADVEGWKQQALSALRATNLALMSAEAEAQELRQKVKPLPNAEELVRTVGVKGLRAAGLKVIGETLELAVETASTHRSSVDAAIRASLSEATEALKAAAAELSPARSPHATMADAEAALVNAVRRLTKVAQQVL